MIVNLYSKELLRTVNCEYAPEVISRLKSGHKTVGHQHHSTTQCPPPWTLLPAHSAPVVAGALLRIIDKCIFIWETVVAEILADKG